MSVWNQPPAKPLILVKASMLAGVDNFELVDAVVNFVLKMKISGQYRRDELPIHAGQCYDSYFYESQIYNGGHSQYIHNVNVLNGSTEARATFVCAHKGLIAMGATKHAGILHRMILWVDANPEEADEQFGFEGGRASALDRLDDEFYEADKSGSVTDLSAKWIKGWSDLKAVDDAEYDEEMNALIVANPKRLQRISAARIATFIKKVTCPVHASIGLALAAADEPEVFFRLFTGHVIERSGEADMAYWFEASGGYRYAIADHAGVAVYECKETPGYLQAITPDHVGPVVGRVEATIIDAFRSNISQSPFAAAADLLLRHARPDCDEAILSAAGPYTQTPLLERLLVPGSANPSFHMVAGQDLFRLTQTKQGFFLSSPEGTEKYGPVSISEAEQHLRSTQA